MHNLHVEHRQGLGANKQGTTEHVKVRMKNNNLGWYYLKMLAKFHNLLSQVSVLTAKMLTTIGCRRKIHSAQFCKI